MLENTEIKQPEDEGSPRDSLREQLKQILKAQVTNCKATRAQIFTSAQDVGIVGLFSSCHLEATFKAPHL